MGGSWAGMAGTKLSLPAGDYDLYATAKNYSQSNRVAVRIAAGGAEVRDFRELQIPGHLKVSVTDAANGKPLDARIQHCRRPEAAGGVSGSVDVFHGTRPQRTTRRADRAGQVSIHCFSRRWFFVAEAASSAHRQSWEGASGGCCGDDVIRSGVSPLVFSGPASSRRPGRSGDTARGFGALAIGGRPQSAVRQRSRFHGESWCSAGHRRTAAEWRSFRASNCRRPGATSMRTHCC